MAPSIRALLIGLLPLISAQGCPFADLNKRDNLMARDSEPSITTLDNSFGKCPMISDAAGGGTRSRDWWPCQLKLDVLRQFSPEQNPLGAKFDYAVAFSKLDCKLKLQYPKLYPDICTMSWRL
jgi:catalase-peroxidase